MFAPACAHWRPAILRRLHPSFRLGSADKVRHHLQFIDDVPAGVVAYYISEVPGDDWQQIWVYLNFNRETVVITLPKDEYGFGCYDGEVYPQGEGMTRGPEIELDALSAMILYH